MLLGVHLNDAVQVLEPLQHLLREFHVGVVPDDFFQLLHHLLLHVGMQAQQVQHPARADCRRVVPLKKEVFKMEQLELLFIYKNTSAINPEPSLTAHYARFAALMQHFYQQPTNDKRG